MTGKRLATAIVLVLLPAADAGPARAQSVVSDRTETATDVADRDRDAFRVFDRISQLRPRVKVDQTFMLGADFGGSDVDTYTSRLRASLDVPAGKRFAVRVTVEGAVSVYDFSGSDAFLDTGRRSGNPWDELISNQARLEARYLVLDSLAVVGGGFLTSRYEAGATFGSGLEGGGFAGATYLWRNRVSLMLGVGLGSRMDRGGVSVAPLFRFGWRISDRFEIQSEGLGAEATAKVSDSVELLVRAGLEGRRYRLEKRRDPIGRGSIRHRRLPALLGVRWKWSRHWRLAAEAGAVAFQEFRVANNRGREVDGVDSDGPAFFGRLLAEYRF